MSRNELFSDPGFGCRVEGLGIIGFRSLCHWSGALGLVGYDYKVAKACYYRSSVSSMYYYFSDGSIQ